MSPSLSSAGALLARAAVSPPSPNGSMSPTAVILISFGVFATSGISFCVWRRLVALGAFRFISAYMLTPEGRGQKDDPDPENCQPDMFDAWAERCTPHILKWEEYTPFSVTVLTNAEKKSASGPVRKVGKRGENAREKREREKRIQGSCQRLQVGVLVAMPSQLHTKNYDGAGQEISGHPLRDGLAIGLVEMPWIENGRLLKKIAS